MYLPDSLWSNRWAAVLRALWLSALRSLHGAEAGKKDCAYASLARAGLWKMSACAGKSGRSCWQAVRVLVQAAKPVARLDIDMFAEE
ncbi:hypothetical protein FIV00_17355 [Labrenzia sp. THAF82]|nr:hypothetical protein FIV00_17355 [Labrenzia sp. THAF82]